ncbi:MAG: N-acetylneuraminate synthase family protein [Thermodesulfobacteriota bacterium]
MMLPRLHIEGRGIGDGYPVFVIAEAGANHNGDLKLAKEMVCAAREVGADCIKFQTFTAEEFCADRVKTFTYKSQGQMVTESEFEMFKRLEFQREEWVELMDFCRAQGILFLTTVQDPVNLTMMLELGLKGIKVGSDDFDHLLNLRRYAATGLPLILSKGMSGLSEVEQVLNAVQPLAPGGVAVLHCVSLYPADARCLNLSQIRALRERFPQVVWGFSDHSTSTIAPALAVTFGARIIEKHFTLDHGLPGPDHWFSMNPEEMREMIRNIRFAEEAAGDGRIEPAVEEEASRSIMRRRVIARVELPAGSLLCDDLVMFKRAEQGGFAGEWDAMRGRRLRVAKQANEGISLDEVVE